MERSGAIFLENTEGVVIEGLDVNHVDGHGVTISGYNRRTVVKGNEISWVGGEGAKGANEAARRQLRLCGDWDPTRR